MCDLWQDEEGIIQSEEETAKEMSSYESEDNQRQVGNKISTFKMNGQLKRFVYLAFNIQSITPHQISTPIITVPIHHLYMTWHEYVNVLTTLTRALLRILSKQRA